MAGPIYYYADYQGKMKLPQYFDKKMFIYDWMRNWIMAVSMDKEGNLVHIEPFIPSTTFSKITDMEMSKDGTLYLIEWGQLVYS